MAIRSPAGLLGWRSPPWGGESCHVSERAVPARGCRHAVVSRSRPGARVGPERSRCPSDASSKAWKSSGDATGGPPAQLVAILLLPEPALCATVPAMPSRDEFCPVAKAVETVGDREDPGRRPAAVGPLAAEMAVDPPALAAKTGPLPSWAQPS
jgi:hypothetical protein